MLRLNGNVKIALYNNVMCLIFLVGDATVTICHRYTPPEHLPICTKMADFVIVATGIPNLITKDMIKPG